MPIHRATFAHPKTGKEMSINSAADAAAFRAIMADCQKAGYILRHFYEDMTDFRSSEGALMVLQHFMPLD